MFRHLIVAFALVSGASSLSVVVGPQIAFASKRSTKERRKAKKATNVRNATAAEAAAAKAEAEERRAPAQFDWTKRSTEVEMDQRADSKRDEAIAKLKKLLPTLPDGDQKAELVFRLSEMYWSKSKYMSLRAMRIWDEQLEQWHQKGGKGPQPKLEDIPELDRGELFKREALTLYRLILARYPRYDRKDEVLYNLGSSLYESGEKKDGVRLYWDLIKQYPDSAFSADAWLQLGEHFFNANKLSQAIKAYERAAETRKPRIYSFALYKLAWCDYNLQEYDEALEKFRGVINYAKAQEASEVGDGIEEKDRIQLLDEALSDMVRAYSHLDAIDDAVEFYSGEVGKEKAYRYLFKLARLYDAEGKYSVEIKMYQRLNADYPYAPQAPQNHTAIVKAYAQLNRSDMVRKEVRRMIDLYSPNGTWASRNKDEPDVLEQAFDAVEQELAALVTEKHEEAQETKLVETYKLARDIYAEYLDKFQNTVNSYRFRFFYAEILFELKEFEKAAEQYTAVVDSNPKGEFAKHAAYTAVLAWEKVLSGVDESLGKKIVERKGKVKAKGALRALERITELEKGKTYEAEPLGDVEQKLAAACDRFVEIAPEDEEVVKVKFKSARLYYIRNQFEEAAERFGEIIDRWPSDELARLGAESILQSLNVREDWAQLNQWARRFRDEKPKLMADKSFARKVHAFIEGASFNEIHLIYEPKGEPRRIADRYAGFVEEFPQSKYAMVGLYNAVVNYDKANLLEKSMAYAVKALEEYASFEIATYEIEKSKKEGSKLPEPRELCERIMFLTASFHERLAEFDAAADTYDRYNKEFPEGEKRSDALYNAAVLRDGLGEYDEAIADFGAYVKENPRAKDAAAVSWRIGLILEKKRDFEGAIAHFEALSEDAQQRAPARALCADYKVAKNLEKIGNTKEASRAYADLLKSYGRLPSTDRSDPCALDAAANAAFVAIEPDFEAYQAISLSGKETEIGKKLLEKLKRVDDLQKRYTEVLEIGQGDYGIASLYRIGFIYQHLAQAIFDTPCPRRLDEDQCMIYQAELQAKAFPLEEKAIEAYDKALEKAYELGLYNEWLAKAQEALKVYEPGRFPEVHAFDPIASEQVFEVPDVLEAQ